MCIYDIAFVLYVVILYSVEVITIVIVAVISTVVVLIVVALLLLHLFFNHSTGGLQTATLWIYNEYLARKKRRQPFAFFHNNNH